MIKRYIFAMVFGLAGTLFLINLSVWQVQRLEQKRAIIAQIELRVAQEPIALPKMPTPKDDRYLAVIAHGKLGETAIHVLTSLPGKGPGYRVIVPFETEGRKILLDRGFIPQAAKDTQMFAGDVSVRGNLDWPRETDSYTPVPDLGANIWFAREVDAMAAALNTEPILLVARENTGDPGPNPWPITVNIRNNHLEYAITWALLAVVWLAMTGYLVFRIRRNVA